MKSYDSTQSAKGAPKGLNDQKVQEPVTKEKEDLLDEEVAMSADGQS